MKRSPAPLRYLAFAATLVPACTFGVPVLGWENGVMAGFDVAALVFLTSLVPLLRSNAADMRRHAATNDVNRGALLVLNGLMAAIVLVTVAAALGTKDTPSVAQKALVIGTLALSWLFFNAVYVLHYAHRHYTEAQGADRGGLEFPGVEEPTYGDFAYFALTLGMTFQTSDVSSTDPALRRLALIHSLCAFAFNIGIVAFTVNVLGSS